MLLTQAAKLGAVSLGGGLNGAIVGGGEAHTEAFEGIERPLFFEYEEKEDSGPPGTRVATALAAFLGSALPEERG